MNATGPEQGGGEADALVRGRRDLKNRRGLPLSAVGMVAFSVLSMFLAAGISYSADEDVTHEVTWLHESPAEVTSFLIFVSPVAGSTSSTRQINVGKPGGSGSGTAQLFSALVPMDANDFVAVAAIGRNGLLSDLSAWSRPQPSQPGQPLLVQP
jgi:hypothetical protein